MGLPLPSIAQHMKIKFLFPLLAAFGLMACGGTDEPAAPATDETATEEAAEAVAEAEEEAAEETPAAE